MSNPYSQPSLSGYNANPPSDDGSATTTNNVKWQTHLDKLAGPLRAFMEAVDANALAAFGLVFGSAVLVKTANYTAVPADRGRFISFEAVAQVGLTLPAAATAGVGFPLLVVNNGSLPVIIDADASETINGVTTLSLGPSETAIITSNGAAWYGVQAAANKSGTFVANWTGFTTAESTTWSYTRVGKIVTLIPDGTLSAISNANGFISGAAEVPELIRPTASSVNALWRIVDSAVDAIGVMNVSNAGQISFQRDILLNTFTAAGQKGFVGGQVFTYTLD